MSHEPPVPPGNQSPYPIQEPPHPPASPDAVVGLAAQPAPPAAPHSSSRRFPFGRIAGAAAGAGAIAFGIAALLFPGKAKGANPARTRGSRKR